MVVLGLIMFGLCQYNKTTLAWVFLIFPVIYLLIQNIIVHIHVSSAVQSAPKQAPVVQRRYGIAGGAMVIPQDTHQEVQQQQAIYVPPPPKNTEMPATTSMSSPLGGSMDAGPT